MIQICLLKLKLFVKFEIFVTTLVLTFSVFYDQKDVILSNKLNMHKDLFSIIFKEYKTL